MSTPPCWIVRPDDLTHQDIDGEVIIVDMLSGKYHSLRGGASAAWACLGVGASEHALACHFGEEHAAAIRGLIAHLQAEDLLVQAEAPADPLPHTAPWSEPLVEVHDDMQALLLADPIHEVDEFGWPQAVPGVDATR